MTTTATEDTRRPVTKAGRAGGRLRRPVRTPVATALPPRPKSLRDLRIPPHVVLALYALLLVGFPQTTVFAGVGASITPARMLGAGCLLWWGLARVVGGLGLRRGRDGIRTVLLGTLAVFAAADVVALLMGIPSDRVSGSDQKIVFLLVALGAALICCDGLRTLRALRLVLAAVVIGASVSAAVALLEFTTGIGLRALTALPGLYAQPLTGIYFDRGGFDRTVGFANHPIELAAVCAAVTPLALHLAWHTRRRVLWWTCVALLVLGVLVSISRTGLLGLALVSVLLLPRVGLPRWVLGTIVGLLGMAAFALAVPQFFRVIALTVVDFTSDLAITSRLTDYSYVSEVVARRPLVGQGFGTYLAGPQPYLDNQYLFTLVESGFPGLLALVTLLGVPVLMLLGRWYKGASQLTRAELESDASRDVCWAIGTSLLVCAASFVTFDALSFPQFQGLVFLLLGAGGAALAVGRPREGGTGAMPRITTGTFARVGAAAEVRGER